MIDRLKSWGRLLQTGSSSTELFEAYVGIAGVLNHRADASLFTPTGSYQSIACRMDQTAITIVDHRYEPQPPQSTHTTIVDAIIPDQSQEVSSLIKHAGELPVDIYSFKTTLAHVPGIQITTTFLHKSQHQLTLRVDQGEVDPAPTLLIASRGTNMQDTEHKKFLTTLDTTAQIMSSIDPENPDPTVQVIFPRPFEKDKADVEGWYQPTAAMNRLALEEYVEPVKDALMANALERWHLIGLLTDEEISQIFPDKSTSPHPLSIQVIQEKLNDLERASLGLRESFQSSEPINLSMLNTGTLRMNRVEQERLSRVIESIRRMLEYQSTYRELDPGFESLDLASRNETVTPLYITAAEKLLRWNESDTSKYKDV